MPPKGTLCPMHKARVLRHGDAEKTAKGFKTFTWRYKRVGKAGHPLADASGSVYVHRLVLYESIGPGTHACHWCDQPVVWHRGGDQPQIHVDHLDDDGSNNELSNLLPACAHCNATRNGQRRRSALLRARGWYSRKDTYRPNPVTRGAA